MKRTAFTALAIAGAGIATMGLLATPAQAETPGPAEADPAAKPPSCVDATYYGTTGDVHIKNNCSSPQKVNVVIDWGWDSGCLSMGPGGTKEYSFSIGSYAGLEKC